MKLQARALIFRPMGRQRARRLQWVTASLVVIGVTLTLIATGVFAPAPAAKTPSVGQLQKLVRAMESGAKSSYVATFKVTNYAYFSSGTITVANIAPVPGERSHPNIDGYSSTLESSYVFRGTNGSIVQWIQDKTNISACANDLSPSGPRDLLCSRPSPYIPSNGYAEESVGLIPTSILNSFGPVDPSYYSSISSVASRHFGELRCILHTSGSYRQNTCADRDGFVISWASRNGKKLLGRVQLISLSRHPTAKDFRTLEKPTRALVLPPF
jgi:hypothetical protein